MVAQLVKGLKPKKLQVAKVRLALLNALRLEGNTVKRELNKTTSSWKAEKPTFDILVSLTGGAATVLIGPGGNLKGAQKWVWIDSGTKKHPITAKNKRRSKKTGKFLEPMLIFRDGRGFTPKTQVGVFGSGPGANKGAWVRKKQVTHPGIKARNWSALIVKRRKKPFARAMLKAAKI